MKLIPILAAAASICAATPAFSALVTYDFEDQTSFSSVNIAANAYGIAATGPLLAFANDGSGSGSSGEFFSNNPSGLFVMSPVGLLLPGESASITTTASFVDSVSFYYSASAVSTVYARDAGGAVLGSVDLTANSTDSNSPYNTWTLATLSFTGQAKSIDFGGALDGNGGSTAAFDNVTVNAVPLPAALLLLPFGAAGLGLTARRGRKAEALQPKRA